MLYMIQTWRHTQIYEYYYWRAKNEWGDIYTDLYISQIYDYSKISEKLDEQSENGKQLSGSSGYIKIKQIQVYEIRYTYRMFTDDIDLSEATALAYEVYMNVRSANARYKTNRISVYVLI